MITVDYHLHSTHSGDGRDSILAMSEAALARGIREVAFTEHLDFDRTDPHYGFLDFDAYLATVADVRDRLRGRLTVRTAIEFDFRREYGREPRQVLRRLPVDFLLGSVHSAAGVAIYEIRPEQTDSLDLRALRSAYLNEVEVLVASGLCHGLGHFDYLYKTLPDVFGPMRDAAYWARVEDILRECVARGVALEVNTHHIWDRGMGLAADEEILHLYRRLGGRLVTVGSDAHRVADVGHGYAAAEAALGEVGFTALAGFEGGKAYEVPLDG